MSTPSQIDDKKQSQLRSIVEDIHAGKDIQKIKQEFSSVLKNVSAEEISSMENSLLKEGVPAEQIQALCDVHVSVFESALEKQKNPKKMPGHPVHTFLLENKTAATYLKQLAKLLKKGEQIGAIDNITAVLKTLRGINIHYTRKENQLFPLLEAAHFDGPTKVMWGKHDEIRDQFKKTEDSVTAGNWDTIRKEGDLLIRKIRKMFFMEEKILFPTSMRKLSDIDWVKIKQGEREIGYAWITPGNVWDANVARAMSTEQPAVAAAPTEKREDNSQPLDVGRLDVEQINLMLKALPLDVTFVDEQDKVRYYSQGKERIFPRSPAVIGRDVQNCHPPKSVHVVKNIIEDFRQKRREFAEFWIEHSERIIHIRYFPVYDSIGAYRGVVEVSQDITDIKKLEGEKRLLDA